MQIVQLNYLVLLSFDRWITELSIFFHSIGIFEVVTL